MLSPPQPSPPQLPSLPVPEKATRSVSNPQVERSSSTNSLNLSIHRASTSSPMQLAAANSSSTRAHNPLSHANSVNNANMMMGSSNPNSRGPSESRDTTTTSNSKRRESGVAMTLITNLFSNFKLNIANTSTNTITNNNSSNGNQNSITSSNTSLEDMEIVDSINKSRASNRSRGSSRNSSISGSPIPDNLTPSPNLSRSPSSSLFQRIPSPNTATTTGNRPSFSTSLKRLSQTVTTNTNNVRSRTASTVSNAAKVTKPHIAVKKKEKEKKIYYAPPSQWRITDFWPEGEWGCDNFGSGKNIMGSPMPMNTLTATTSTGTAAGPATDENGRSRVDSFASCESDFEDDRTSPIQAPPSKSPSSETKKKSKRTNFSNSSHKPSTSPPAHQRSLVSQTSVSDVNSQILEVSRIAIPLHKALELQMKKVHNDSLKVYNTYTPSYHNGNSTSNSVSNCTPPPTSRPLFQRSGSTIPSPFDLQIQTSLLSQPTYSTTTPENRITSVKASTPGRSFASALLHPRSTYKKSKNSNLTPTGTGNASNAVGSHASANDDSFYSSERHKSLPAKIRADIREFGLANVEGNFQTLKLGEKAGTMHSSNSNSNAKSGANSSYSKSERNPGNNHSHNSHNNSNANASTNKNSSSSSSTVKETSTSIKILGGYSHRDRTAATLLTAGIKAQIIAEIQVSSNERATIAREKAVLDLKNNNGVVKDDVDSVEHSLWLKNFKVMVAKMKEGDESGIFVLKHNRVGGVRKVKIKLKRFECLFGGGDGYRDDGGVGKLGRLSSSKSFARMSLKRIVTGISETLNVNTSITNANEQQAEPEPDTPQSTGTTKSNGTTQSQSISHMSQSQSEVETRPSLSASMSASMSTSRASHSHHHHRHHSDHSSSSDSDSETDEFHSNQWDHTKLSYFDRKPHKLKRNGPILSYRGGFLGRSKKKLDLRMMTGVKKGVTTEVLLKNSANQYKSHAFLSLEFGDGDGADGDDENENENDGNNLKLSRLHNSVSYRSPNKAEKDEKIFASRSTFDIEIIDGDVQLRDTLLQGFRFVVMRNQELTKSTRTHSWDLTEEEARERMMRAFNGRSGSVDEAIRERWEEQRIGKVGMEGQIMKGRSGEKKDDGDNDEVDNEDVDEYDDSRSDSVVSMLTDDDENDQNETKMEAEVKADVDVGDDLVQFSVSRNMNSDFDDTVTPEMSANADANADACADACADANASAEDAVQAGSGLTLLSDEVVKPQPPPPALFSPVPQSEPLPSSTTKAFDFDSPTVESMAMDTRTKGASSASASASASSSEDKDMNCSVLSYGGGSAKMEMEKELFSEVKTYGSLDSGSGRSSTALSASEVEF